MHGAPRAHLHRPGRRRFVATAKSTGTFDTLVAALDAAGKTSMLQEKGPYTVFAPTDDAFKKLPKGTVEGLLKPENKEKLGAILAYHVMEGKVMAADVKTMKAPTANGAMLNVKVNGSKVMVNDANLAKADVKASNGVIHVIDKVLMPPKA
ncbi:MAG: fasciclin domain-containing protein [Chthoniobacterales bacterium]|nr:fasciclin domain-containing protein [Chthoniobacterales bacterium]